MSKPYAAHFDLATDEAALRALLAAAGQRRSRTGTFRLDLAVHRDVRSALNVWHEVGQNGLEDSVRLYPYIDTLSTFPVRKCDVKGWFDAESPPAAINALRQPGVRPVPARRSVLFVTPMHPGKAEGNSRLMRDWLRRFGAAGYEIHLLYYATDGEGAADAGMRQEAWSYCSQVHELRPVSPLVGHNLDGRNVHVDDWCGPELVDTVRRLARRTSFDIAFVNYAFLSAVFEAVPAFTRKILLTHDRFEDRNRRLLAQGLPESGWVSLTREGEGLACARADEVVALQEEEAAYFRSLTDAPGKVVVVSPVFEKVETPRRAPTSDGRLRLGFFGSHNWVNETNLAGYLAAWRDRPDLLDGTEIVLAGGICTRLEQFVPADVLAAAKPRLLGRVDHLSDLFGQCDVILNPERGGTGIKIKTLETMAHGMPLLSTAAGCVGIDGAAHWHRASDLAALADLTAEVAANRDLVEVVREESVRVYDAYAALHAASASALIGMPVAKEDAIAPRVPWPPVPMPRRMASTPYVDTHAAPYHKEQFQTVLDRVDLRGKRVLEIGSDFHLASARLFAANGAREVLATNIGNWRSPEPLPNGVTFTVGDVGDMDLEAGSFDLVYGIAILEHVPQFGKVVETCKRVLAPDGVAYLQGCPIWGGNIGHHVWYDPPDAAAEGPARYNFADPDSNPIPDWAHLAIAPEALADLLRAKGVPHDHAEGIVDYVHDRPGTFAGSCSNFQTASAIVAAFRPVFDIAAISWQFGPEPNEHRAAAAERHSAYDLDTLGLELWMRHPERAAAEARGVAKVSIIVPFYGVEDDISDCLDSVRAQDHPALEVVLVDDCGTDRSRSIAERHAIEDARLRILTHDRNRGLGPARNTGTAAATGDYLFFLDSDDVLAGPTVLREIVQAARNTQSQVVTARARQLLPDGSQAEFDTRFERIAGAGANTIQFGMDAFHACFGRPESGRYLPMRAWGTLIDAGFYGGLGLSFPSGVHEDIGHTPVLYGSANQVQYLAMDAVLYRQRAGGISNAEWTAEMSAGFGTVWDHFQDMLAARGLEGQRGPVALLTAQQLVWKLCTNPIRRADRSKVMADLARILRAADPVDDAPLVGETMAALRELFDRAEISDDLAQDVLDAIPDRAFIAYHAARLGVDPDADGGADRGGGAGREAEGSCPRGPAPIAAPAESFAANDARANGLLAQYRAADVDDLCDYPSMLTEADKAVYYDAALTYRGEGLIVDGGPFVGCTTQHLVRGLRHNPRFGPQDPRLAGIIKVYDLFRIDDDYILRHLKDNFPDRSFVSGGSFRPVFDALTEPHARLLDVHAGDVTRERYAFDRDIEVLGVDLCKALPVTDHVVRTFFPRLIEGGLVIQQDFIHEFHPHIHLSMLRLDDHFERDAEMRWGGSVTFRARRPITQGTILERFGVDASWFEDRDRNIALLEELIDRTFYDENRWVMMLTLGFYHHATGDAAGARSAYERARRAFPQYEISDITRAHLRG